MIICVIERLHHCARPIGLCRIHCNVTVAEGTAIWQAVQVAHAMSANTKIKARRLRVEVEPRGVCV